MSTTSPAFLRMDDRYTDQGGYGIQPYGTSAYGGHEWPPFILPELQSPSDDIQSVRRRFVGEIVHRRLGMVIGARTYATIRKWRLFFHAIDPEQVDEFLVYFDDREFWLLPYGEDGGTRLHVRWSKNEFKPKHLVGGYYNLDFEIEEVLS